MLMYGWCSDDEQALLMVMATSVIHYLKMVDLVDAYWLLLQWNTLLLPKGGSNAAVISK